MWGKQCILETCGGLFRGTNSSGKSPAKCCNFCSFVTALPKKNGHTSREKRAYMGVFPSWIYDVWPFFLTPSPFLGISCKNANQLEQPRNFKPSTSRSGHCPLNSQRRLHANIVKNLLRVSFSTSWLIARSFSNRP